MRRALASAAIAVTLAAMPAAGWAAQTAEPVLLRVGDTGVRCLKEPCPWRGVVPMDSEEPAYAGDAPPVIAADAGSMAQIRSEIWRAWANGGCLVVSGRFDRAGTSGLPVLSVARIVGPCTK